MATFNKAEINAISNRIKHGALCMACFQKEPDLSDTSRDIIRSGITLLEEANKLLTGEDTIRAYLSGSFCGETPGALAALEVKDGRLVYLFTDEHLGAGEEEEEE